MLGGGDGGGGEGKGSGFAKVDFVGKIPGAGDGESATAEPIKIAAIRVKITDIAIERAILETMEGLSYKILIKLRRCDEAIVREVSIYKEKIFVQKCVNCD